MYMCIFFQSFHIKFTDNMYVVNSNNGAKDTRLEALRFSLLLSIFIFVKHTKYQDVIHGDNIKSNSINDTMVLPEIAILAE